MEHQIIKRRHQRPPFRRPLIFRGMAHSGDAGRLLDDDDMRVDITDRNIIEQGLLALWLSQNRHGVAGPQSSSIIKPKLIVYSDAPPAYQVPHLRPALARQPMAQQSGQGLICQVGGDGELLKEGRIHGVCGWRAVTDLVFLLRSLAMFHSIR